MVTDHVLLTVVLAGLGLWVLTFIIECVYKFIKARREK